MAIVSAPPVHVCTWTATEDEIRRADVLAYLADDPGNEPEGYRPGWQEREPEDCPTPMESWGEGYDLGYAGLLANPIGSLPRANRREFRAGHAAGHDLYIGEIEDALAEAKAWQDRIEEEEDWSARHHDSERRHRVGGV